MATYGGENKRFASNIDPGKKFYVIVDAKTGEATYWEDKGILPSVKLGTKKPGEDFQPTTQLNAVFNQEQQKKFLSDENQKKLDQEAEKAVVDGNIAAGVNPTTAQLRAKQLLDPDFDGDLADPNQSAEDSAAQAAQQGLDDLSDTFDTVANSKLAQARTGTRKGPASFGDFSYPLDRNQSQDFMKFTLLEYKPKKISTSSGTGFGFSDRQRVGPNGQPKDRTILGSCSLPIPGGIKDDNGAEWAPQTMDALEAAQLGLASDIFEGQGVEGAKGILTSIGGNSEDLVKAIKGAASGAAAGVGKQALTRTTGMIFNPNLELLFDKPTLRGFTFTFDLVPRSKKEAEECIKIIRFFKQGMAPIRAASNLFLLSPNVFQVHYVLDGDGNKDHPYIGKMKECAMTNFRVDYTPQQNYSTLADGFMTAYKISMDLKELEPVFNDDYEQDGSQGAALPVEIGF